MEVVSFTWKIDCKCLLRVRLTFRRSEAWSNAASHLLPVKWQCPGWLLPIEEQFGPYRRLSLSSLGWGEYPVPTLVQGAGQSYPPALSLFCQAGGRVFCPWCGDRYPATDREGTGLWFVFKVHYFCWGYVHHCLDFIEVPWEHGHHLVPSKFKLCRDRRSTSF